MIEKIIPFQPNHIELMDIRDIEIASSFCLPDAKERMTMMAEMSLAAGTFLVDGQIVFAAGVVQMWPGVLDGWIIPTIYVPNHPIWFVKKIKGYFEAMAETFKCHRFQTVSPDDEQHEKWMLLLGFEKEGCLKAYSHNKKDYCMWSRSFQWA